MVCRGAVFVLVASWSPGVLWVGGLMRSVFRVVFRLFSTFIAGLLLCVTDWLFLFPQVDGSRVRVAHRPDTPGMPIGAV